MDQFNSIVNDNLGWIHENKYVFHTLSLFLGMYVALARPKLPTFIAKLFENPLFRIVVISYIVYRGNKDPQLSIMIATAFLVTMHMINKTRVENFSTSPHDAGKLSFGCDCVLDDNNVCPCNSTKSRENFSTSPHDAGKLSFGCGCILDSNNDCPCNSTKSQ